MRPMPDRLAIGIDRNGHQPSIGAQHDAARNLCLPAHRADMQGGDQDEGGQYQPAGIA